MRKIILVAGLIVGSADHASAAMPYFYGGENQSTATAASTSTGWSFPKPWRVKEKTPDPKFFYQAPATTPTKTERFTSAVTDNAAVNTVKGWMKPDPASTAATIQPSDPLSLSQPIGRPTPKLMVLMAQTRERQGDISGAREMYQQSLAAAPNNTKTLREIGHFEDRQNKLADAERYYAQATKLAPQDSAALNDLGLCLARQGKLAPAADVLNRAIAVAPTKALYRNNMATVLMEMGDQRGAMSHLMAVHTPPVAYYNMGNLLENSGQQTAAMAHYAEAMRLDPSLEGAQTALARLDSTMGGTAVPQTAMVPSTPASYAPTSQTSTFNVPVSPVSVSPATGPQVAVEQQEWPSMQITPKSTATKVVEPEFGPRLLPPME